jgi:hypothetical protein
MIAIGKSFLPTSSELRHAIVILAIIILALTSLSAAQESYGSLSGTVHDATGAVIAGASVFAVNTTTSQSFAANSNSVGKFVFQQLPLGTYDVKVRIAGFEVKKIQTVQIAVGQSQSVDVAVDLGGPRRGPTSTFVQPVWNVWTEDYQSDKPKFTPKKIRAGKSFLLVVDLSAIKYDGVKEGATYSHRISGSFDKWLQENSDGTATVQILAIPDERFFERLNDNDRVRPLEINLARIRRTLKDGFVLDGSPFNYLAKSGGKAAFSFGDQKAAFQLRSKDHVKGATSIALSIWADGKPVDEISFPACVTVTENDTCSFPKQSNQDSLEGVDVANRANIPDAALHLVELDSSSLVGVFRCNTCGWRSDEFRTWRLGRSADWFRDQFATTVLPKITLASVGSDAAQAPAGSPDQQVAIQYDKKLFEGAGDALYGLVFHSEDGLPVTAAEAFRSFVSDAIAREKPGQVRPSLFVRLLPQQADKSFIVPIALARVEVSPGKSEYLGFHFRIQTPLELQDYSASSQCISKWIMLVPPDNLNGNPLAQARQEFAGWITTFATPPSTAKVYDDLDTFNREWLKPMPVPQSEENDAVLILSHHEKNTLHFDPDDAGIFPDMKRRYAAPSIVILAACQTASPGAFEFVREFNLHGASAVMASAVDVVPKMGGRLLALLATQLDANSNDQKYTLDRALFDALATLSGESDGYPSSPEPWGGRVLIFELIGNGGLHVCVPHKSP